MCKEKQIIFKFLYEIYHKKTIFGIMEHTDSDINIFFKKSKQIDKKII
ncbi:BrxA family protein [Alkalibaculum bacchi]